MDDRPDAAVDRDALRQRRQASECSLGHHRLSTGAGGAPQPAPLPHGDSLAIRVIPRLPYRLPTVLVAEGIGMFHEEPSPLPMVGPLRQLTPPRPLSFPQSAVIGESGGVGRVQGHGPTVGAREAASRLRVVCAAHLPRSAPLDRRPVGRTAAQIGAGLGAHPLSLAP